MVFLIGAGIATWAAQKNLYVDISQPTQERDWQFRTIQEAFEFLDGKRADAVMIAIAPGVYPRVVVPDIDFGGTTILTPYFDVDSESGAGSVIIDGGGNADAISYATGWASWMPRQWHGLVLSNAVHGATGGFFARCMAVDCDIGFQDCQLEQCVAAHNRIAGAVGCMIEQSLVTENHVLSTSEFGCLAAGVQGCELNATIVWNNTIDGVEANMANSYSGYFGFNCTKPLLPGSGNICADPRLVNPSAGDYRLQMGSPCINTGNGGLTPWEWENWAYWSIDLGGFPRIQRGAIDIGPYEYQPTNEHQTITAPEPVEFAWIDEMCPKVLAECGGDYDKAVLMNSANPVDISLPEPMRTYYSIWESYVADLDPTDSNQTFRATIEMVDGEPVVKGDPESPCRKFTVLGKEKLSDEKWQENLPGAQFFKVKVGLQ